MFSNQNSKAVEQPVQDVLPCTSAPIRTAYYRLPLFSYCFRYLLALLFCLAFSSSLAQKYKFDHLTLEDGLTENGVFSLHLDQKGFLWAGTCNGLIKYDGNKFKTFLTGDSGEFNLAAGCIYYFHETKEGNFWLATYHGLVYFDAKKDELTHVPHLQEKVIGIENALFYVYKDGHDNLWMTNVKDQLIRYDLTTKTFTYYFEEPEKYPFFQNNKISSLRVALGKSLAIHESENGDIWIGTVEKGLLRFRQEDESFSVFSHDESDDRSLSNDHIYSLFSDTEQRLWVGTAEGLNLWNPQNENFRLIKASDPDSKKISEAVSWATLEDDRNKLWIAGEGATYRLDPQSGDILRFPFSNPKYFIVPIHESADGSFWVLAWNTQNNLATLYELDRTTKTYTAYVSEKENKDAVNAGIGFTQYLEDNSGVFWLGSFREGINKLSPLGKKFYTYYPQEKKVTTFQPLQAGRPPIQLVEDQKGVLWQKKGQQLLWIREHLRDQQGNIWMINNQRPFNTDGLGVTKLNLANKTYTTYFDEADNENTSCGNSGSALLKDSKGNIWMGFWDYFTAAPAGLVMYDPNTEAFTCFEPKHSGNHLAHESIADLHEDKQGNIWIGLNGVRGEVALQKYDPSTGQFFSYNNLKVTVWEIEEDEEGFLWLGTILQGLVKFDPRTGKIVKQYLQKDGLANSSVQDIEFDKAENLWLRTEFGVSKFNPKTELFENFTVEDGLIANRSNGTHLAFQTADGDIFMATPTQTSKSELIYFSPEKVIDNPYPPKIAFTDFKLYNKEVQIGKGSPLKQHISHTQEINLTYKQNDFTLEFAALHFNRPAENEYAYKLEPLDTDWRYIGTQNNVTLSGISAGDYTFKVKACNYDGVWNDEGISLNINIAPPWWETTEARIIFLLSGILLVYGLIQWRISNLKERQRVLEKTVKERTAEVVAEKERSDKLLLNILPAETAEELKQYGEAKARNYDLVTVLFADIQNFTRRSEELSPRELVAEIDHIYKAFDLIMEKHGVEKIKTIGDAYMAAGGVPTLNKSNPEDTLRAALSITEFMESYQRERKQEGRNPFKIRIGVHTGPVVAGIVGIKKFAYDIWGDTVNVASRLESSGEINKINVSQNTYELTKHVADFNFVHRGKIKVKNKGEIDMYFLN